MIRIPYQDAPAALFYLSGAAYGTAAGIVSALPVPEPRRYVLRALKNVWDNPNWGGSAATEAKAVEPAAEQQEHSMLPIVVAGGPQSGKSTLLSWWSTGRRPVVCKPTVGADLFTTELCTERHRVSVQIWDTAGGTATLDRLGPGFWRKAAAFLYILSVSNVGSFNALTALHGMLQDQAGAADGAAGPLASRPTVVLGAHRQMDSGSKRQVTVDQAEAWCRARGAVYLEMRGPEDVGAVSLAIDLLVRACVCPVANCAA